MRPSARLMELPEVDLIVEYFHQSTLEYLETLGVDPTRVLDAPTWRSRFAGDYREPIAKRKALAVVWEMDGEKVGFSTADKITFGCEARIHLHILCSDQRVQGLGTACVKLTIQIYFETLILKRLFCEPNAFNVTLNSTLQKVFFKYLKNV